MNVTHNTRLGFGVLILVFALSACSDKKSKPSSPPSQPEASTDGESTRTVAPGVVEPTSPASSAGQPKEAPPKPTSPPAEPKPVSRTAPEPVSSAPSLPAPAEPGAPFTGIVAAHNEVRQPLGLPLLEWSESVAAYAQEWADYLKTQNCNMKHRTTHRYGENLAWGSGLGPRQVVHLWAREGNYYDHNTHTCQAGKICGHYTQVIWKKTTTLGCGMARCGGTEIWVCNYNPPGNYRGRTPY